MLKELHCGSRGRVLPGSLLLPAFNKNRMRPFATNRVSKREGERTGALEPPREEGGARDTVRTSMTLRVMLDGMEILHFLLSENLQYGQLNRAPPPPFVFANNSLLNLTILV